MLFNSIEFALFMAVVFLVYWAISDRFKWIVLLTSSYYFYMGWNAKYVFLIFFTTLVSYGCGLLLERTDNKGKRKIILTGALIICLGILFLFKYFSFFFDSLTSVLSALSIQVHSVTLKLLLPVGISFYTFQTLSYVIDVYNGNCPAEHHFGKYATFISFFPQLVAGPIERTTNLMPQIKCPRPFDYNNATYGLKLMAWGFLKKIAIADVLAQYVDMVYGHVTWYKGFSLVLVSLFFTLQIYCDFSGYSDIAIGTAKLLNIDLMTNFRSPYFSSSIKEFWARWHISLSTWFRDYVYIPLGGNRVGKLRHRINLVITFLLSGLWHGANWTFVVWGGVHGLANAVESLFPKKEDSKWSWTKWMRTILVFGFCGMAWVLFRANSISDAIYVFANFHEGIRNTTEYFTKGFLDIGLNNVGVVLRILLPCVLLGIYDYFSLKRDVIQVISSKPVIIRWIIYFFIGLMVYSAVFIYGKVENTQFIYFQF